MRGVETSGCRTSASSRPGSICEVELVDDLGARILDVVEAPCLGDGARLRRLDPDLEPDRACACRDGLPGVARRELRAAEDIHEVDLLADLRERGDARHAHDLGAVARTDRYDAVPGPEQVAHHVVAGSPRLPRGADHGDRLGVGQDLRWAPHQSMVRIWREVNPAATRQREMQAPRATIVPGAASPETAPAASSPNGVSPKAPNQSRLTTRESMCCGTSSISIVSQTAMAKPMQMPRQNEATTATEYHGERAKTITSR